MVTKKKKNFLLFIKKELKLRNFKINKSIIQNNNIKFMQNNLILNSKASCKKALTQLLWKKNKHKNFFFFSRWEIMTLINNNESFLIKKK